MSSTDGYREEFEDYLKEKVQVGEPKNLYEPIVYILGLGGKRIRPSLVLMAAEIFGTHRSKALDAALAIEVFHNFSLVHDDIMDAAPLRRGNRTVHKIWDINTGILAGDAMLIKAYQLFENYPDAIFRKLAELFSQTAIRVCEGQQYDIDFETRDDVTIEDYLQMIEYKTAVLVGASLKMGATIAETSEENREGIYEFGKLLGIAFQLQDDYLDAFGDPETFGKQVGGDIIGNKKTFLYLSAVKKSASGDAVQLEHLYSVNPNDSSGKIETVKGLFESSGAAELTRLEIQKFTNRALETVEKLELSEDKKALLRNFAQSLMNREM